MSTKMKLAGIMLGAALTTTAAFACPNLTGQYLCNDEYNGEYIETITQTGQGAKTIYTSSNDIDGETLVVADGKWKNFSQAGVTINFKATCVGKVLNVEVLSGHRNATTNDPVLEAQAKKDGYRFKFKPDNRRKEYSKGKKIINYILN